MHHSDGGVHYRTLRYVQRLEEQQAFASVRSSDDSYDNTMVEPLNSLFKAEQILNHSPWQGIGDLEVAVAELVDW